MSTEFDAESEEPTNLGAAETIEMTREAKAAHRKERRANIKAAKAAAHHDDVEVTSVYEPYVRYVPPLRPYLSSLWERRAFIAALARSQVKANRASTALGGFWALLDPLFMGVIYFALYSTIRDSGDQSDFLPILLNGILAFQLSSAALTDGGSSVTSGKHLMLNSTFPRALLPLSALYKATLAFMPALIIIVPVNALMGAAPTAQWLWYPVLFGLQLLVAFGMSLVAATLVVFFRDAKNAMQYVARVLFFGTPIIYPVTLTEDYREILMANPIYGIYANYQYVLGGGSLDGALLAQSVAWGVGLTLFGSWLFLRHEREFASRI